jgi:hypothetical protein
MRRLTEGQIGRDSKGYFRFSKGYIERDGKRVSKFFSCGKTYAHARIVQEAANEVWSFPGRIAGDGVWSPEMLARVEKFVEQRYRPSIVSGWSGSAITSSHVPTPVALEK